MRLNPPKNRTWLLSLLLGVLGLVGTFVAVPIVSSIAFWLVLAGLVLLLLGCYLPGL